jgi:hypothetical protein
VTRGTGQITTTQSVVGALMVIGVAAAIVVALDLLVLRGEQEASLGAPAQEETDDACPEVLDTAGGAPEVVAADELLECPSTYDGALVTFEGEAVRAVLRRGERAWLHLNDDRYALELGPLHEHRTTVGGNSGLPVSVPTTVAENVRFVGDARHSGDILSVTGIFHRADPADGGGPTIQARTARITQKGRAIARPVDRVRAVTATALAIAALTAALVSTGSMQHRSTNK